jgi:endonuclease-3
MLFHMAKVKTNSAKNSAGNSTTERKAFAGKVVRRLARDYSDAVCALNHESPFQLLIATILSAQCTDERVNIVTKDLFAKYPAAEEMSVAPIGDLEKLVKTTGFFRNKARNIKDCAATLVEKHNGEVPKDLDALTKLAGVGRKTANVVLGTCFGFPSGVVVDTHVARLSKRLGLTAAEDPVKIESDLMALLPKKEWIDFSHRLIHHGRRICNARKPMCEECGMKDFCPRIGVEVPG